MNTPYYRYTPIKLLFVSVNDSIGLGKLFYFLGRIEYFLSKVSQVSNL